MPGAEDPGIMLKGRPMMEVQHPIYSLRAPVRTQAIARRSRAMFNHRATQPPAPHEPPMWFAASPL
jgi:hypothetical protein